MRIALLGLILIALSGCFATTPTLNAPVDQAAYRYDGIDPALQGDWVGFSKNEVSQDEMTFMLRLQRGVITNVYYLSHKCAGRLKYQRTEPSGESLFLEQIDIDKVSSCDKNSYVKFLPNPDGTVLYSRYTLEGKLIAKGLMSRKQ